MNKIERQILKNQSFIIRTLTIPNERKVEGGFIIQEIDDLLNPKEDVPYEKSFVKSSTEGKKWISMNWWFLV